MCVHACVCACVCMHVCVRIVLHSANIMSPVCQFTEYCVHMFFHVSRFPTHLKFGILVADLIPNVYIIASI